MTTNVKAALEDYLENLRIPGKHPQSDVLLVLSDRISGMTEQLYQPVGFTVENLRGVIGDMASPFVIAACQAELCNSGPWITAKRNDPSQKLYQLTNAAWITCGPVS